MKLTPEQWAALDKAEMHGKELYRYKEAVKRFIDATKAYQNDPTPEHLAERDAAFKAKQTTKWKLTPKEKNDIYENMRS